MEAEKPAGKRLRTKYDAAFRVEVIRCVNQDGQVAMWVTPTRGMSEVFLLAVIFREDDACSRYRVATRSFAALSKLIFNLLQQGKYQ